MKRPKHISCILFLMIFFCSGIVICADGQSGIVIFAKGDSINEQFLKDIGAEAPLWTPSRDQIAELEKLLDPFLKSHPPEDKREVNFFKYGRQYYGVTKAGKKCIFLNAFCAPELFDADKIEKEMVLVLDGGSCYFQVFYDPMKKEFSNLRYNGVA